MMIFPESSQRQDTLKPRNIIQGFTKTLVYHAIQPKGVQWGRHTLPCQRWRTDRPDLAATQSNPMARQALMNHQQYNPPADLHHHHLPMPNVSYIEQCSRPTNSSRAWINHWTTWQSYWSCRWFWDGLNVVSYMPLHVAAACRPTGKPGYDSGGSRGRGPGGPTSPPPL